HTNCKELVILDVKSGDRAVVANDVGDFQWLDGNHLLWLKGEENSNTSFIVADVVAKEKTQIAGQVLGPVSDLKITAIAPEVWGVAVSGKARPDGTLHNPANATKPLSSAKLYTSLFVRHWDEYVTAEKNTIFFGALQKTTCGDGSASYSLLQLNNLLHSINIKGLESPIPTFGGADHFDICPQGIVFISKDPALNDAMHTKCNLYYVQLESWTSTTPLQASCLDLGALRGALTSPVLSPKNNALALLAMQEDGYESDKNRIVIVPNLFNTANPEPVEVFATADGKGAWNRSPGSLTWTEDESSLLVKAEDAGTVCLFQLATPNVDAIKQATVDQLKKIPRNGSVGTVFPKGDKLFLTTTSLISNGQFNVLNMADSSDITFAPGLQKESAETFGLHKGQVDEIWWKGANDRPVHAWVVKPSNFDANEKYPLCFLVHGGPQGAWNNSWSTRWNPVVFAEQGYVVVAPNPT
ncbi:hypothetical protein KEM55_005751, partial [Ascosphaera atra]